MREFLKPIKRNAREEDSGKGAGSSISSPGRGQPCLLRLAVSSDPHGERDPPSGKEMNRRLHRPSSKSMSSWSEDSLRFTRALIRCRTPLKSR